MIPIFGDLPRAEEASSSMTSDESNSGRSSQGIIAFGARTLTASKKTATNGTNSKVVPKYLNSRNSCLFEKVSM